MGTFSDALKGQKKGSHVLAENVWTPWKEYIKGLLNELNDDLFDGTGKVSKSLSHVEYPGYRAICLLTESHLFVVSVSVDIRDNTHYLAKFTHLPINQNKVLTGEAIVDVTYLLSEELIKKKLTDLVVKVMS